MKATLISMWRLFHALAFYPIMIGGFLWLYFKGAHWIWGAAIIAGILIFDPIWRIMGKNILRMIQKNSAPDFSKALFNASILKGGKKDSYYTLGHLVKLACNDLKNLTGTYSF